MFPKLYKIFLEGLFILDISLSFMFGWKLVTTFVIIIKHAIQR